MTVVVLYCADYALRCPETVRGPMLVRVSSSGRPPQYRHHDHCITTEEAKESGLLKRLFTTKSVHQFECHAALVSYNSSHGNVHNRNLSPSPKCGDDIAVRPFDLRPPPLRPPLHFFFFWFATVGSVIIPSRHVFHRWWGWQWKYR